MGGEFFNAGALGEIVEGFRLNVLEGGSGGDWVRNGFSLH